MQKSNFELSSDTRVLAGRLSRLQPDELVKYAELNELVGRDVRTSGRGALTSAIRIVSRDHGVAVGVVRKVGVKRLTADELPSIGDNAVQSIRGKARRATRRMLEGAAKLPLGNDAKIMLNARLSALGAISLMSSGKSVEKLEGAVRSSEASELPVSKTLELFKT